MKEISELTLPEDVRYSDDHEWARQEGDFVRAGISDYAQDQLGDIIFVEFPEIGETFEKGEECGTVESVKTVSELYMPVGGEVTAVNENLAEHPEMVNSEPYNNGWMIEIRPTDFGEMDSLMGKDAYLKMLKG
ncbi:MAG: glycine cleavage system protein GcvH [Thermodesulfobacteriota bacterium]|nr:glycine cleavage system protein GcvH [Thermodesulfobacteriota bacterium]